MKRPRQEDPPPPAGTPYLLWLIRKRLRERPEVQQDLAGKIGVPPTTVTLWKNSAHGRGGRISPDQIVALASHWEMTTDQLLGVKPLPPIDVAALRDGLGVVEATAAKLATDLGELAVRVKGGAPSRRGSEE
jgi:hypothetical protein